MADPEFRTVTTEGASAPSATSGRRWWLKMTAASAALVALLLGAVFLGPPAWLNYHAWRYRTGRDPGGSSLERVISWAARRRSPRPEVVRLLGEPQIEIGDQTAGYVVRFTGPGSAVVCYLDFEAGRATKWSSGVDHFPVPPPPAPPATAGTGGTVPSLGTQP